MKTIKFRRGNFNGNLLKNNDHVINQSLFRWNTKGVQNNPSNQDKPENHLQQLTFRLFLSFYIFEAVGRSLTILLFYFFMLLIELLARLLLFLSETYIAIIFPFLGEFTCFVLSTQFNLKFIEIYLSFGTLCFQLKGQKIESYNINRNSRRVMELEKCKQKINTITNFQFKILFYLFCALEIGGCFFTIPEISKVRSVGFTFDTPFLSVINNFKKNAQILNNELQIARIGFIIFLIGFYSFLTILDMLNANLSLIMIELPLNNCPNLFLVFSSLNQDQSMLFQNCKTKYVWVECSGVQGQDILENYYMSTTKNNKQLKLTNIDCL